MAREIGGVAFEHFTLGRPCRYGSTHDDCTALQEVRAGRMVPEQATESAAQDRPRDAISWLPDQAVFAEEHGLDSPTLGLPDEVIELLDEDLRVHRVPTSKPKEAPRAPGNSLLSSPPVLPQQATPLVGLTPINVELVSPFGPMPSSAASQRTRGAGISFVQPPHATFFNPRAVSGLRGESQHERSRRDAGTAHNLPSGDLSTLRHVGRYPPGTVSGELPFPKGGQGGYGSRQPDSFTAGAQMFRGWACGPAGEGGGQRWQVSGFDPWQVQGESSHFSSAAPAAPWPGAPRYVRSHGIPPSIGILQELPARGGIHPAMPHLPVIGEAPDALRMRPLAKRTAASPAFVPRENGTGDEPRLRDFNPGELYRGPDHQALPVLRAEAGVDNGHKWFPQAGGAIASRSVLQRDGRIDAGDSVEAPGRLSRVGASMHSATGVSGGLVRHLAAKVADEGLDGESREHWKAVSQIVNKQWVESDKFDRILAAKGISVPPLRFADGGRKPGARLGVVANALQAPSVPPGTAVVPPIMRSVGALPAPFRRPAEGEGYPAGRLDPPASRWFAPQDGEATTVCGTCGKCRMAPHAPTQSRQHPLAPLPDSVWKRVGAADEGSNRRDLLEEGGLTTATVPAAVRPAARAAPVVWPAPSRVPPLPRPAAAGKLTQVALPFPPVPAFPAHLRVERTGSFLKPLI